MQVFSQYLTEYEKFKDWSEHYGHKIANLESELQKPKSDDFIYDAITTCGVIQLQFIHRELSPELQMRLVSWNGKCIEYLHNPTNEVVKVALTSEPFIKYWHSAYENFVKRHFKDNTVLMNKWLRYRDNMREIL